MRKIKFVFDEKKNIFNVILDKKTISIKGEGDIDFTEIVRYLSNQIYTEDKVDLEFENLVDENKKQQLVRSVLSEIVTAYNDSIDTYLSCD